MRRSVLPLVILSFACAEERAPIDRTQPNALEKRFFVGEDFLLADDDPEFWAQATLIDVGYGASQDGLFTSTYAQPVIRIKWVIQEDYLIGRLTYERIDGSDGKGAGPSSTDGQLAYAYKILSHFDVRRSYNPLTGEELNVLEENTTDRPWYQRQYVRVDWAKNEVESGYELDTLSQIGVFGGVEYENLAYYVNDPQDPNAPRFEDGYFDITQKAFAKPQMIDLAALGWGQGEIPACFLPNDVGGGTEPIGNCNAVELTVRHSFRRVTDSDYEPAEWDGFRFQAFGAFTTERKGYNRKYGLSDEKWRRLIARYNIWGQSHYYADFASRSGAVACFTPETTPAGQSPHRDLDGDGTEDECAAVGRGSRCDEFNQRCTLPYADRPVRPIVWYYTPDSHPDYFEATAEAANQWDVALRSAVVTARYTECMKVERNATACEERFPVYHGQQEDNEDALALAREVDDCRQGRAYQGQNCDQLADNLGAARGYAKGVIHLARQPELVVLCHSPVLAEDPEACGPEGLLVRQGDLRYHQVNVIRAPQTPSPWGIYTDAHDPLTGETLSASINVWSHVGDLFSQGVIDKARYAKGELTTAEITEGTHVQDWVRADMAAGSDGVLPRLTRAEVENKLASFAQVDRQTLREVRRNLKAQAGLAQRVRETTRALSGVKADAQTAPTATTLPEARRARALGSELEAELDTPAMRQLAGVSSLPISEATRRLSSPLSGNHPNAARQFHQRAELAHAAHGACVRQEAPSPTSITGLADVLEAKFGAFDPTSSKGEQLARAERMRRYVAERAHFSVILHEMGHSVGLRHNFVSSSDAYSYRPQYWQLRTRNGQVQTECTDLAADGTTCVGPRWFDPVTEEERQQLIWMFMHSSTMDYAGELTQDMLGLGAYDFAAARMFYGDAISVFTDSTYQLGTGRGQAMLGKADNFGGILGFNWTDGERDLHYSQLQQNFQLIRDCQNIDPNAYRPAAWDEAKLGAWHPVLDGGLVAIDGQYSRCKTQPVDYLSWEQLRPATDAEAGGFSRGGNTIAADGRVRVPYGFATDRWADLGNLAVYRHDNGADAYELFNFFVSEQEVNHIFDNYRRRRQSFSVRSAVQRSLGRYNEKMRDGAKGLGLIANTFRDIALAEGLDFNGFWPFVIGNIDGEYNNLSTNVLAAGLAFDQFTRMLGRPEAGEHYLRPGEQVLRSAQDDVANPRPSALVVPNGVSGGYDQVGIGGRPVENAIAENQGEYDSEFTINAGSYYDKAYSAMLLTESVDNFISDSRRDFVDARYRAVSMADLFPEGYRRWLANNLTGDDAVKGAWVRANAGAPDVDADSGFPTAPLGWTSWWTTTPEACFPAPGSTVCSSLAGGDFGGGTDLSALAIDPQVGFEQQKFLIAWTLIYLPENQQRWWLDQLGIWSLGADSDPGFANRIELHDPNGEVLIARTYGKETVFGKSVERGIAARMLEYGNQLLERAYLTDPGPDLNGDEVPDWRVPALGADGQPVIRWDPTVAAVTADGRVNPNGRAGCNRLSSLDCRCEENRACVELQRYRAVPVFLRTALRDLGLADPSMKGLH